MTAREYFEGVLSAERDLARLTLALNVVEERAALVSASPGAGRSRPSPDGTISKVNRIFEARRRLADRIDAICELEDEARGYVERLPLVEWREAVERRYIDSEQTEETASAMGRTTGAVRAMVSRAMDWLDLNCSFPG